MSLLSITQLNQTVSIVRRAELDILATTGIAVSLQLVAWGDVSETPEAITRIAAEQGQVTYEQIISKSRVREVVSARFIAIKIIRQYFPEKTMTLKSIGQIFGMDHTNVKYAEEKANNYIETEPQFRQQYTATEKAIEAWILEQQNPGALWLHQQSK